MMTNQDLESCKRDIEIIKSTIERSKVNLGSIAPLFIIYGVTVLLFNFSIVAVRYFTLVDPVLPLPPVILHIHAWSRYLLLAVLFVLFYRRYRSVKASDNPYALQLMRIWGIAMFLSPMLTLLRTGFVELYGADNFMGVESLMLILVDLAEVFAFLFSLLFTGIILNHKLLTASALIFFPLIFFILFNHSQGCLFVDAEYIASFVHSRISRCNDIVVGGYALLGIYFLCAKRRKE